MKKILLSLIAVVPLLFAQSASAISPVNQKLAQAPAPETPQGTPGPESAPAPETPQGTPGPESAPMQESAPKPESAPSNVEFQTVEVGKLLSPKEKEEL
jgi:hypothetical protein